MYKYVLAFVLSLFSFSVYAETAFDYPVDDAAAIAASVYSPEKMSGRFIQKKILHDMPGMVMTSSGNFSIDRNSGLEWKVVKPFSSIMVISGGKVCSGEGKLWDGAGNRAVEHVMEVVQSLLVQDYATLGRYFELFFKEDGSQFHIGLEATDETMASVFTRMEVSGRKYVEHVVLHGKEGDRTEITFSEISEQAGEFSCE